jgi:hypothetical protein
MHLSHQTPPPPFPESGMWLLTLIHQYDETESLDVSVCEFQSVTASVFLVHERTIPTEKPLLIGEVSANFCG